MKQEKNKIIIDFDGTLFDTEKFHVELFSLFKRMGYSLEQIEPTYQAECLSYKYSPIGHLQRLQAIKPSNQSLAVARFNNLYEKASKYIFPDVKPFLEEIGHRGENTLILLTLGDIAFQKAKVENSGIMKYFDQTYFCDVQKWLFLPGIVDESEKFIFIDDRADTLFEVGQRYRNSFNIRIDRYKRDDSDLTYNSQIKVRNLEQALKLLS